MEENYVLAKKLTLKRLDKKNKLYPMIVLGLYGLLTKYSKYKDLVIKTFLNSNIYIENGSVPNIMKRHNIDTEAFMDDIVAEDEDSYGISSAERSFYVENQEFTLVEDIPFLICSMSECKSKAALLNTFMHEMGHLIKGSLRAYEVSDKDEEIIYKTRTGLTLCKFIYNKNSRELHQYEYYSTLDEGINSLQTNDAMMEIKALEGMIPDKEIEDYFKEIDFYDDDFGYAIIVELLTQFWNIEEFKKLIEDNIVSGTIDKIINYFDEVIYKDSLDKFDEAIEIIDAACYYGKDDISDEILDTYEGIYEKFKNNKQKVLK